MLGAEPACSKHSANVGCCYICLSPGAFTLSWSCSAHLQASALGDRSTSLGHTGMPVCLDATTDWLPFQDVHPLNLGMLTSQRESVVRNKELVHLAWEYSVLLLDCRHN